MFTFVKNSNCIYPPGEKSSQIPLSLIFYTSRTKWTSNIIRKVKRCEMLGNNIEERLLTNINDTFTFKSGVPPKFKKSNSEKNKANKFKWSKSIKNESQQKNNDQHPQNRTSPSTSSANDPTQDIEVSIIIPSHNKYPLNLFTLYSLEYQTLNPKKMEVIFIDDASTDQTEEILKSYQPPYHFKYIRSTKKLGRAKVRNLGIHSASGSVLIFLDGEMITEPEFVENHYKYHQSQNNIIVSGAMHSQAIYSCIFPAFSEQIMNRAADLTKNNKEIYSRLQNCKYPLDDIYPLLEKNDIARETYKDLSFNAYPWYQQITNNFNTELERFAFPWMAFLTGNISIRKELIVEAGLFDEEFYHYGYEDWELGYRLFKMGAKYIVSSEIITYHQEHPVGERKWREAIGNFGLFTIKHHEVDVLILGLELARITDLLTMNNILNEYKLLLQTNPDDFHDFSEKFMTILETIYLLLEVDIRHFNILGAAGFSSKARKELKKEIKQMKKLKKYPYLTEFLATVMNS